MLEPRDRTKNLAQFIAIRLAVHAEPSKGRNLAVSDAGLLLRNYLKMVSGAGCDGVVMR
jgi:hypothetical protein